MKTFPLIRFFLAGVPSMHNSACLSFYGLVYLFIIIGVIFWILYI